MRTVLVLVLASIPAFAQELVGSRLLGTITDPSGVVVPNVPVKITASATGASRVVVTAEDGTYVAPQLLAGVYEVEVSRPGFRTSHVTKVVIRVNESARLDVRLELGDVTTRVEVVGQAALVNTYTSELSQTVDSRRVVELPLNARDVTSLSMLAAGATDPVQTSFYASSSGFAGTAPSVNGSRIQDNSYLLDGVSNLYSQRLSSNMYPNPDAVEQFTINLAQYSAEFGGRPGGQLSARTKSGTNDLHGSLFEFVRNSKFNARNWADTRGLNDGIKRNQYGWAVGGPVYIPKVFNGRNRLFWFNSFQQIPLRTRGRPGFHLAFTDREKQGNFSERLTGNTRQVVSPLCDGTMLTVDTSAIFDPRTANSRCGSLGNPFPSNIIPTALQDPVAVRILRATPSAAFVGQQLPFFIPQKSNQYEFLQKVDLNVRGHGVMVRYLKGRNKGGAVNDPNNLFVYSDINADFGTDSRAESIAATETWTPKPNLVLTGGFVYIRNPWSRISHPNQIGLQDLGSRLQSDPNCKVWTVFISGGFMPPRIFSECGLRGNRNWEMNASAKWIRGRHEIGFGGIYGQWGVTDPLIAGFKEGGSFNFTGGFTGLAPADFLVGRAETYTIRDFGVMTEVRRHIASLYVQDNLRVNRRLTLNVGLRWEPGIGPQRVDAPSLSWYYPGQRSQRFANAPAGVLYGGDPGTPGRENFFRRYAQFAPRFGFSFDPTGSGKWAIRGGVGSYFGIIGGGQSLEAAGANAPPLPGANVTVVNPPSLVWPWDAAPFNGREGVPLPAPTSSVAVPTPFGGNLYDPNTLGPNTWQWSFTLERSFSSSLLVRAAYVGTRGVHLQDGHVENLAVFIPGASTVANQQQRRPNQNFTAIHITGGQGDSHYHALQLTVEQRYAHNLSFLLSYTLSKSIDTNSANIGMAGGFGTQDPRGPSYNRGLSDFDRTHVFSLAPIWDLPRLSDMHPVVKAVFGSWQTSGIIQLRSGFMITPTTGGNRCLCGSGVSRADLTGQAIAPGDGDRPKYRSLGYFNTAAFRAAELGTFGAAGRNIIRGPGYANVDFLIAKNIPIRENMRVQFRSEYFNLFNRVNLAPPILDTTNPNFGRILTTFSDPRILQFGLKFQF